MTLDLAAADKVLAGLRPFPVAVTTIDGGVANGLMSLIFAETTTFGVRTYRAQRRTLPREHVSVCTSFGDVRIKLVDALLHRCSLRRVARHQRQALLPQRCRRPRVDRLQPQRFRRQLRQLLRVHERAAAAIICARKPGGG